MTQFDKELPKDLVGQKTTAVPIGEANHEWTTPVHLTGSSIGYDEKENMFGIRSTQKKFRDSFSGASLDLTKWDVIQTGAGQTISQTGGALVIGSGTTINSETIIQSKEAFTVSFRAMFGVMLSQRIANQEFYVELVSVDDAGNADGLFAAAWKLDGTSVTQGKYQVQSGGLARLESSAVTISTTASYAIKEIECFADETWFHDRGMDSASGRSQSYVRHQQIPDPNRLYKIRIRAKNLGTAPASNTNFSMQYITVVDYAELTTEITASRGTAASGMSMPVQISNNPTVYTQMLNTAYSEFTAALAAGATSTATGRDMGASAAYNRFRIIVAHTAGLTPAHLVYEQSTDNSTWRETHRVPLPSDGSYRTFEFPVSLRYVRAKVINGATAQTLGYMQSMAVRSDGPFDLDKTLTFVHSTTALGASGVFTGTALDLGANHSFNRHRALATASHDGTLVLEQSRDNTNWRTTGSINVTANTTAELEDLIVCRYVRVKYTNGATAQSSFELISALIRN